MKRFIHIDDVKIKRDERQRREIGDTTDLQESLKRIGLINPIVLDEEGFLISGERRLSAAKALGWTKIEFRTKSDLSPNEIQLIELDENLRRKDLNWKDTAEAFVKIHEICGGSIEQTVSMIGYSENHVRQCIRVGRALRAGEVKISDCASVKAADNILSRIEERAISAELSNVRVVAQELRQKPGEPESTAPAPEPVELSVPIICENFISWANTYTGKPFNFVHCDFPYGINHHKSDQGGADEWGSYQDDPDTYWSLVRCLIENKSKLFLPSSHLMFWFSMTFYEETKAKLRAAGFEVQDFPLIWHKTDSKGILPDPTRGPRRVYETALLASLGDRKIIKAVDNTYGCPTNKSLHLSEKPEPMLRHFFRMLVDEFSEVLDPTCGSGNALLAATRSGAKRVFGLELNPENAEIAQVNYRKEIAKDNLAKAVK